MYRVRHVLIEQNFTNLEGFIIWNIMQEQVNIITIFFTDLSEHTQILVVCNPRALVTHLFVLSKKVQPVLLSQVFINTILMSCVQNKILVVVIQILSNNGCCEVCLIIRCAPNFNLNFKTEV